MEHISEQELRDLIHEGYDLIKSFIQDSNDISKVTDEETIKQIKNELKNQVFLKYFTFDNGSAKIFLHKNYGYVKIIKVKNKISKDEIETNIYYII